MTPSSQTPESPLFPGRFTNDSGTQVQDLWDDWKRNALDIAQKDGLRSLRDGDLHYWSKKPFETFGSDEEWGLLDFVQVVVRELFRLSDAWLLTMAILRLSSVPTT